MIDDYTHYIWTFPLRAKSDVFHCLVVFHAYVQTQFSLPLLAFQIDNDREFDNHALRSHCEKHGIVLRLSCPYTSSQNGKAERIIRTLNDCVRSLLLHAGLPPSYWVEALLTATHLINRRPCRTSGRSTPHELLLGAPPSYASAAFVSPTSRQPYLTSSARAPPLACSSDIPKITVGIAAWIFRRAV